MTDAERDALVERMAEEIHIAIRTACSQGWDALPWAELVAACDGVEGTNGFALLCARRNAARAALAVAEPVVRADEREACIVNARTALDRFGAWNGSITPDKLMKPIEKRIRARGDA